MKLWLFNRNMVANILLRAVGLLLMIAAGLKSFQLLTEPVANTGIWSYRPFLIFTVEFELALAIWLLSGLFKKAAWLATLACFSLFSVITLYKAITGADSCGCFGSVKVNPWITLLAIDLPIVVSLLALRPKPLFAPSSRIVDIAKTILEPRPQKGHAIATAVVMIITLGASLPVLALNEPPKATSQYEVLEPETWIGKPLPIIDYIDIGEQLKTGTWLVLFYHYDCPECQKAISEYGRFAHNNASSQNFPKIAFIDVSSNGRNVVNPSSTYRVGKLSNIKKWFITTPAVLVLTNGKVRSSWEQKAPDIDAVVENVEVLNKTVNPE